MNGMKYNDEVFKGTFLPNIYVTDFRHLVKTEELWSADP